MDKVLITQTKGINLFHKLFYDKIYTNSNITNLDHKDKLGKLENKIINLESNFINVREEHSSQNFASKISKELIDKHFEEVPNFFKDSENYNFLYWDLRKYISVEVNKLFKIINFTKKIEKNFNLKSEKIYINPETVDVTLLNLIKKKHNLNYKIDFFCLVELYLKSFFKKILGFICIIFLPEIKFFFCKKKSIKKKFYKVGYNIFHRQIFSDWHGSPDFFLKNKMFNQNEVLYILNSKLSDLKRKKDFDIWDKDLNKKKYNIVNLSSLSKFISYKIYLKKIYFNASRMRFFFLKNFKIMQLLNINSANTLNLYINWMIFFEIYSIKSFFSSMIFGENISNFIQSKKSDSTNFIYFSTSGKLLENKKYLNYSEYIQFSFAKYDNFYGNRLSYQQLLSWENILVNFVETGNLSNSYILNTNKSEILKKLKINNNKKLVLFTDAAIGISGIQSNKGFAEYIGAINKISNLDNNYNYLFKSKSSTDHIYSTLGSSMSEVFDELLNNKNVYFYDDFKLSNIDIETHQLIAASEICVSTSLSSLTYDALCAKKKTIVFDPDKIYNQKQYIYTKSKLIYAQNFSELCELLNYWKDDSNKNMLETINKTLTQPYIDKYCDHRSIERFISNLK